MPFTYAHPAAVLPFFRVKKLSASAMIIGSLAPDYDYVFRMDLGRRFSHEWPGVVIFTLPLAIIMFLLFHALVKRQLIPNLPFQVRSRWAELYHFDYKKYIKNRSIYLILSVSIGIFSHIIWDSFTHEEMFLVSKSNFLTQTWQFGNRAIHIYTILQHLSSIVGVIALFIIFLNMEKSNNAVHQNNSVIRFWTILTFFAFAIFIIRFLFWPIANSSIIVTSIIGSINYALLVSCLLVQWVLNIKNAK